MNRLLILLLAFAIGAAAAAAQSVQIGAFRANETSDGFTLHKPLEGERFYFCFVQFDQPFDTIPKVVCSISSLNAYNGKEGILCLEVEPARITPKGFAVRIRIWGDTRVFDIAGSWTAVGPCTGKQ